jgi:hypothetical protein
VKSQRSKVRSSDTFNFQLLTGNFRKFFDILEEVKKEEQTTIGTP